MKTRSPRILFIIVLSVLAGCAGGTKKLGAEQAEHSLKNESLPSRSIIDKQAYNYYTNGTILEAMGEYYTASREYARALDIVPNSNQIRYSYATTLMHLKDYRGAISQARKIIPHNANTWMLLGDSYRSLQKYDSSISAYRQAVKLDSTQINAFYFLGSFYQQMQILDSAIWAFEHVAKLSYNYQAYQQLANLQLQNGQIDDARESYLQSLEIDSTADNVRSYLGLSAIYEESGDYEKGKRYLESAAKRAPEDKMILNRLLNFYSDDGEYEKALEIALKLWKIGPSEYGLGRRLGILYFNLDSLQIADSIFTDLIRRGDNHIVNHYYAGQIAFIKKDFENAKDHFEFLTTQADSVIDGWMNLGMVYHKQDSLTEEVEVYQRALKYLPQAGDSMIVLFAMGAALEQQQKFDSAIETFEKVLEINPDHAPALNYLGYMLVEKGVRLGYAEDLIKKALKIDPDNGAYIDSYGWLLYQKGKYEKALKELLRAYELIGSDPIIMVHVGDAYFALGEHENAEKFWKMALEKDPENKSIQEKLNQ